MERNQCFKRLSQNYFFRKLAANLDKFKKNNPHVPVISLCIGDTTEPLTPFVIDRMASFLKTQGQADTYIGYGAEEGMRELREKISSDFYNGIVEGDDVFISDGAKCDIARLQLLFGPDKTIVLQDPVYPAYRDIALLGGASEIFTVPCCREFDFIPDFSNIPLKESIIYLCSPNNPVGNVLTYNNLRRIIDFAFSSGSIIVFDAVYSEFISDPTLPRSIYEVEGAEKVAIEINSFSKSAGFTGIRLGWSVFPKELTYRSGESLRDDWVRLLGAGFNGASLLAQNGGLAHLTESLEDRYVAIAAYKENARMLKEIFETVGYTVYGGDNSPYLWIHCPDCPDPFDFFLNKYGLAVSPGEGFGEQGKGFVRLSAFGTGEDIEIVRERVLSSAFICR